ncbi:MAG: hypothetical protein IMY76_08070 [Chloroflexi bacterium]|nr:hypothetical protein [Chloroflexota bacterium]
MNKLAHLKTPLLPIISGLLVCVLTLMVSSGTALASPHEQEGDPTEMPEVKDCGECHLDIAENWSHSPHAHAYDDPVFQDRWVGLGEPGECLACHTTNYLSSTDEYSAEGVACESCHGITSENHPPEIVPVKADTDYCGSCHTTTLSEWRLTGHAAAEVGCMDCHDPHSQGALFENSDEMCINCHQEDEMGDYLNDLHVQNDIGCVDCHALVIPPEIVPDDGIVPTGHTFIITTGTCVACHTDALHAGFSLPGYENGAKEGNSIGQEGEENEAPHIGAEVESDSQPEQRLEALETALASRNMSTIFQGGVIGIVLGGTTAWIVARNIRRLPNEQSVEDEETVDDEEA